MIQLLYKVIQLLQKKRWKKWKSLLNEFFLL